MRAHTTQLGSLIGALAGGTAAFAGPAVTEFEHNAGGWLGTVSGEVLHAFDEFRPGLPEAAPCLAGTPGTSLYLAGGVVTLGKFEGGAPGCALSDGSTAPAVSDGSLTDQAKFVMDFCPPLSAFYTYYGSLAVGETVTMSLYSNGALVTQLESDQSFHDVDAAGHGFVSDVLIDRIEFTSTDSGGVLVGAFVGLLAGEGSLGTVVIPGYPGPDGETVQIDFGLVFTPDCNDNGIDDAEDIAQGGSFDTNGNSLPDECEFSGSINGAVVWGSGSTVYLASDLSVADSLTVEPGVEIVPAAGVEIVVQAAGQLTINGTGAQPVRLRPVGSDRWDGIRFAGGAGELRHAELERLNTAGITIVDASPLVDFCTIRDVAPPADVPPPLSNCCVPSGGDGCDDPECQAIVCPADPYCCNVAWDAICADEAAEMCGDLCLASVAPSPGASAFGVRVLGDSNPAISNTVIQGLTGADGFAAPSSGVDGYAGFNGINEGGAQACGSGGYNGSGGQAGSHGFPAPPAQNGGDAIGVYVGPGAAVQLASCRINDLQGGNGGAGEDGGTGGPGGDGGNGGPGFACGGNGGQPGWGGYGANASDGGRGGDAIGVFMAQPADSVVEQNVITHLAAGSGAYGGNGGSGGAGGDGGGGYFNVFNGGNGGNAGDGGWGGDAGDGGRGGRAQPISVVDHASLLVLSQNTVDGNLTRGAAGTAGLPGLGGAAGSPGQGYPDGEPGLSGGNGAFGINGVIGNAVGINASAAVVSPPITASNNIIVPGNADYSVGMQVEGFAVIVGNFDCFFDFNVMVTPGVSVGWFVADPLFVDADGIDNLPGTEDDNRRLAQGSPCVDTGGNAEIPPDAADLDGDANTAEPLPLDADGNPRVSGAAVDVGVYEFGSGVVPCPWDCGAPPNGIIDVVDFLLLLQQWGQAGTSCDFNSNGVDTVDFLALLQHWGPCP